MAITLEKPAKPDWYKVAAFLSDNSNKAISQRIDSFVLKYWRSEYIYWDKFKYKEPSPSDLSKEELWSIIKFARRNQSTITTIKDKNGKFFSWAKLDYFDEFFHQLDMNTGGELFVDQNGINKTNKQKYIVHGIMEEAIASSQLEGAATSRTAAKKMLLEGRKPKNSSEQMIVNNYVSMKAIEENYKNQNINMDLLLELHEMITRDTLDSEGEKPKLRSNNDTVFVRDHKTGKICHEGPKMDFIKTELNSLMKFANDEHKNTQFIHPIVKAVMLHFWIGYLHPFTDGNGRLARLLFYWYLLKNGYWAFAYLPISKAIKRSPDQYKMAFIYSEQDDNDLTYFIDYNIKKINTAIDEFKEFLIKQSETNIKMKSAAETKYNLNFRQVQLLQYLHGSQEERTTLKTHMNVNKITNKTASTDLKTLVQKQFLLKTKQGRNVYYYGTKKIQELF